MMPMRTIEEIWTGDVFKRKAEAEQVIGFLESVTMRPSLREDGHAFVLAVDAPYGVGKSYFLRRFAEHMGQSHPVAFVDAWTDDLEDEPLVALAATLERAFEGLDDPDGSVKDQVANVVKKTGAVAKIALGGLFKRGISLAITTGATEAAQAVIEEVSDSVEEAIDDTVTEAVNDAAKEITKVVTPSMRARIEKFNEGRKAIEAMKQSLRDLVAVLGRNSVYPPPIVIVIDELDRCRPTYAIKLLEEIKHLFDVKGIAFVLGMHREALGHSVAVAYGSNFDGSSYLRRFISRTYNLRQAELYPLVQWIFRQRDLDVKRLTCPPLIIGESRLTGEDPARVVSLYMAAYDFTARDAFTVADAVETCLALTGGSEVFLPLLMPWMLSHLRGKQGVVEPTNAIAWHLVKVDDWGKASGTLVPAAVARELWNAAQMSERDFLKAANQTAPGWAVEQLTQLTYGENELAKPRNYDKLLQTVDRFSEPMSD